MYVPYKLGDLNVYGYYDNAAVTLVINYLLSISNRDINTQKEVAKVLLANLSWLLDFSYSVFCFAS